MDASTVSVFTEAPDVATPPEFIPGYIFHLIVYVVVFLFGVPGNSLILRVYWTKTRKTSTNVLIMALAWNDLAVSIVRLIDIVRLSFVLASLRFPRFLVFIEPFEGLCIANSLLITALIAADRYDCVCRPAHRRFFNHKRAKLVCWAALAFAFVTVIPECITAYMYPYPPILDELTSIFRLGCFATALVMIAVCYGKVYATIRKHVRVGDIPTSTTGDESRLAKSNTLQPTSGMEQEESSAQVADKAASTLADKTLPTYVGNTVSTITSHRAQTQTLAVSTSDEVNPDSSQGGTMTERAKLGKGTPSETGRLAVSVNRNPRKEPSSNGTGRAPQKSTVLQRKTTRMLFITSVVFLLLWLPYWFWVVLFFASQQGASIHPVVFQILFGPITLVFINNAVNPLIYGLANRRFRKDCKEVLGKIKVC